MAKRTLNALAKLIINRLNKPTNDTDLVTYVENMLNVTLQEIISNVEYAEWLLDQDTIDTVAAQQYVTLPSDLDIDSIVNIIDTTNNYTLVKITIEEANTIDPGRDLTGYPRMWWHQIVAGADRIYFLPRPDQVYTETLVFGNIEADVASGSTSVLPAKYEGIWMDLTLPKIWERINPNYDTSSLLSRGMGGFNAAGEPTGLARIIWDAKKSKPSGSLAGHRPQTGTTREIPSFPSDYDTV